MNSPTPGWGHPANRHLNYVQFVVAIKYKAENQMDQVVSRDHLTISEMMRKMEK